MNIIKLAIITGLIFPIALSAQKEETKVEKDFNTWSLEVNVGMNNAIKPFTSGYSASNESKFFSTSINHFDIGVRYMLTPKFGFKLDLANDKIENASGGSSLHFETQQYRLGLQGIMNVGRLMGFDDFTHTLGLLIHAGVQVSTLTPKTGINKDVTERDGGILFGITPQVKLSNHLALTADFTYISNVRQHLAWDGNNSAQSNNLNGQMYTTSLGLTYSFGKKENHADWFVPVKNEDKVAEILKQMDAVKELMNDSDRDGVVDHIDVQNNTPTGVAVDSKGRFLDVNNNGTPDELESNIIADQKVEMNNANNPNNANNNNSTINVLKELVEKGYVNIFFDVNQENPNSGSTNSIFQIIEYVKTNPENKIILSGYADVRGDEKSNKDLSKRRAENIRKLLIDSGINATRIVINPQGVDKDLPNSKTGLDLARRVSIQISK
jgi:OOP family OmpA-OmpF porin